MSDRLSEHALRPVARNSGDIGPRFMLVLLGGIGGCLILMLLLAYVLFPRELRDQRFAQPFPHYPAPVLQPSPPTDMRVFLAQELQRLNGTGWIDRAKGTVHIPIQQAMRAVAAEGIAGWPTGSASASEGSRR